MSKNPAENVPYLDKFTSRKVKEAWRREIASIPDSLEAWIALLHQKAYPTFRLIGGQEILIALSAGEMGAGDGPRNTSSCHFFSRVCEPSRLGSAESRAVQCG
jgi:hypothetical protein